MNIVIPDIKLSAIAPELALVAMAIVVLFVEVFSPKKRDDFTGYLALLGVAAAAALVAGQTGGAPWMAFSGLYVVDGYGALFKYIGLLAAGMAILMSINYDLGENSSAGEFHALLLLATAGMFFMISGADLITIFMGLELMSISLYALAGYTRRRDVANEAAVKYFILGALSSAILLYGVALLYGATGSTKIHLIAQAVAGKSANWHLMVLGGALVGVGFAFKVAAAPFHMWTPDVYQGAPAPVTAFMSTGPKAAAFAAFFRVFHEALGPLQADWWTLLWVIAAASMTVGNVAALLQNNVKRMLAYSSIAHAGYVLVAFLAGGKEGSSAIMFYLLAYTFMNIGAFAVVAAVARAGEERVDMRDYAGVGYQHPLLGLAMLVFLFSLAGIPPTAGFVGKFYVFMAALKEGYVWLVVIAVLNSVLSVFYYLRLTVMMYMRGDQAAGPSLAFGPAIVAALAVAIYGTLWIGVNPGGYLAFAQASFLPL